MNGGSESSFVALVPMRRHSERVPGKNSRPLAGKPLYAHILDTLSRVRHVSRVVVDTDSPEIRDGVARLHPRVLVLDRPEALQDDQVPMNDIIDHDMRQLPGEFFLQTHSTNPLLRSETIEKAIEAFLRARPEKDSLFSVTRLGTRLWDRDGRPLNHDPNRLLRTQDLPPVYEENSCLYLFDRTTFERRRNRIGARPLLFEIEREEAWDIDEELDFEICVQLMSLRRTKTGDGV